MVRRHSMIFTFPFLHFNYSPNCEDRNDIHSGEVFTFHVLNKSSNNVNKIILSNSITLCVEAFPRCHHIEKKTGIFPVEFSFSASTFVST